MEKNYHLVVNTTWTRLESDARDLESEGDLTSIAVPGRAWWAGVVRRWKVSGHVQGAALHYKLWLHDHMEPLRRLQDEGSRATGTPTC